MNTTQSNSSMTSAREKVIQNALREDLGESIHTGFRKGCFAPQAHKIWTLIQEMDREDWGSFLEWVADCTAPVIEGELVKAGYVETDPTEK